jgi:hypothetical protein
MKVRNLGRWIADCQLPIEILCINRQLAIGIPRQWHPDRFYSIVSGLPQIGGFWA